MKFAIAIIAGLALVASIHAAPAAEDDVYISDSLREIIAAIRGKLQVKIDDLQKRREEIREQIRTASEEAKEELKKSLERITNEVRSLVQQLLEVIKRGIRTNDEAYFKDAIVEKIRDYREKAKEILQRVTEIVKKEAAVIGEEARARFEEHKQILIDQVQRINEQIKKVVTDVINGKEQQEYSFERRNYFVDLSGLRARIAQLVEKMKDLAAQAGKAAGVKRDELLEQLKEARDELVGAAKDLRNALRDVMGKEPITYSIAEDLDEVYFVQTAKDLRRKLNEKLEELKAYAEMIKAAHGVVKEQIKLGFEAAKEQVKDLRDQILEKIKEELNKPHVE